MTSIPLTRILTKAMLRPWETPEWYVALRLLGGSTSDMTRTSYWGIRTGRATWETPGFGCLPKGLEAKLVYWVTPWCRKERPPVGWLGREFRTLTFPDLLREFRAIVQATKQAGTWIGPPAKGILLHGDGKDAFILTDGHHRLGALAALDKQASVPIEVASEWDLDRTLREGYLSDRDNRVWWEHVWRRLDD